MSTRPRTALLAGATGLVGSHILQALLADANVAQVVVLARRPLTLSHPKLLVTVVAFDRLPALPPVDEAYLALGTTIKVAGSQAAFKAVDVDANLAVARAAVAAGARRVGVVSAVGASAGSGVFYNRMKGELEDALKALPLQALVIAQPSLLLGDRSTLAQPARLGERLAMPLMRLVAPLLPGIYRPVQAQAVAQALVATVPQAQGVCVLNSGQMAR
ncbi:MAG: hypothetical protein RI907_4005 [Pseudomonadota bacterium]|jgi:uncharacterized protein YbjT (DUF2867 family)